MSSSTRTRKRTRELLDTPTRSRSSSLSPPPDEPSQPALKKSKKAVTRPCPVCGDKIPVRLLGAHANWEMNRVQEILSNTGPSAIIIDLEEGPSTGRRGAALKARRAVNPRRAVEWSTIEQIDKTIKLLQRHRKTRNLRLKEIIAQDDEDEEGHARRARDALAHSATCPVCLTAVRGDPDVIDAHVDSCIANAARLQREAEERERVRLGSQDPWSEVEVDGEIRLHLNSVDGLRGSGIHVRDRSQIDIEEDVDVDGDDEFGTAQFTEVDVVDPISNSVGCVQVDDERDDEDEGKTLRDLVSEGKVVMRRAGSPDLDGVRAEVERVMGVADTDRMNQVISAARRSGDKIKLVAALEDKIRQLEAMRVSSSTSLLCRICLDAYSEPTVSTGCWHTCCRECWLRCLGSTRLCPICKRITAATDLRRVYM